MFPVTFPNMCYYETILVPFSTCKDTVAHTRKDVKTVEYEVTTWCKLTTVLQILYPLDENSSLKTSKMQQKLKLAIRKMSKCSKLLSHWRTWSTNAFI